MAQIGGEIDFITTYFVRSVDKLNAPSCLFKILAHSLDTHACPSRHATSGLFKVRKSRTNYGRLTVLHRAMTTWNSVPHQVTDASSRIRVKKQVKIQLMEEWGLWSNTNIGTDTCIHTHDNIRTIHTCTHGFCVVDMWYWSRGLRAHTYCVVNSVINVE